MATVLERILGIEKRSGETSGLTNPAEWLSVLLGAGPTRTKIAINPQTAVTIATVFACVRVLSEDLAKIPLEVLEDLGPDESRPAPDQPAYRLLNIEPNPEMDAMILRETATAQMLLWGNGYLEVVRNGAGMPVEVWPLLSGNCVPMRVYDRGAWGRVVYSYQDPEGRRKPARIPAEDVIHLKCLGGDGTMGWSVVRMARESFGLSAAADGFGAAFFGNGARPGGVLEHPGKLNPAAQDTIRASWNKIHGGVDNANNIAILAEGMKFSPYSMPNNEAQFLETRRFQVEEICRWFRVPPQKVADHSRSTFGNVEEINAQYADDSLGGWMRRWEGEGRRKLFTQDQMMRYRLEHNEAELRRGRLKDRYDSYAIGRQWGWLSPNDILRMEGRNPLPAEIGDVYLVPSNMTTPDRMAMAAAAGAESGRLKKAMARCCHVGPDGPHSIVRPALRMSWPKLSNSRWLNAENCSGVMPPGSPPSARRRACTSGSCTTRWSSACRRRTVSAGVPLVTNMPYQVLISKPLTPASARVGTWASSGLRRLVVTASGLNLPALMLPMAEEVVSNMICTLPAMMSRCAWLEPR